MKLEVFVTQDVSVNLTLTTVYLLALLQLVQPTDRSELP